MDCTTGVVTLGALQHLRYVLACRMAGEVRLKLVQWRGSTINAEIDSLKSQLEVLLTPQAAQARKDGDVKRQFMALCASSPSQAAYSDSFHNLYAEAHSNLANVSKHALDTMIGECAQAVFQKGL